MLQKETYRYEYQGAYADKDPITGFNNFDLRMYDGRIGRWLSTDPNAQYYSPYVGMGNNPVSRVDPDGGFDTEEAAQQSAKAAGVDPSSIYNNGGKSGWGYNTSINDGIVGHFGPSEVGGNFNANSGVSWDNSKLALDIGGGIYGALQTAARPGNQWAGKNGKYYNNSWGGNQYTGSRSGAFKAASTYKWAGRATVGVSALIGVAETYNGYQMDGGQFGYNAQSAAFGTTGSLIGGYYGAIEGAATGLAFGAFFGPPGLVIGPIVGGLIGGFGGSYVGGKIGSGSVNYYHGR